MAETRIHMSKKPIVGLHAVPAQEYESMKPRGFWYGFGAAWLEWCSSEMPGWIGDHCYEVTLAPETRILRLDSERAIRLFRATYGGHHGAILWSAVALKYDAVECNPYLYDEIRFECGFTWYYSWDVPSGCVWNADVVSLRAVERPAIAQEVAA